MINIAFLFPGQGAQFVGMGKEFYEKSPEARKIFDKADQIIPHLTDVTFHGPAEKLTSTAFCQPAIFTFSIAALAALKAHPKFKSMHPCFAAGLSLGEYSGLAASGALDFESTLRLVERRSFFMEQATKVSKGKMAAVIGLDKEKLLEICKKTGCEVANFNSPEQIVITGHAKSVDKAKAFLEEAGAKRVIMLDVSGAFHSRLMQPAVKPFEEELKKVNLAKAIFPIISNVDANPAEDPSLIRDNLARQITSSVKWVDSINYMVSQGVKDFLEVGPGTVLKGLVRKINPELKVHNIQTPSDIDNLPF